VCFAAKKEKKKIERKESREKKLVRAVEREGKNLQQSGSLFRISTRTHTRAHHIKIERTRNNKHHGTRRRIIRKRTGTSLLSSFKYSYKCKQHR